MRKFIVEFNQMFEIIVDAKDAKDAVDVLEKKLQHDETVWDDAVSYDYEISNMVQEVTDKDIKENFSLLAREADNV